MVLITGTRIRLCLSLDGMNPLPNPHHLARICFLEEPHFLGGTRGREVCCQAIRQ